MLLGSKPDGSTFRNAEWSCGRDAPPPACTKRGLSLCSKCRQVKYCSKNCQLSHWNTHKTECNLPEGKEHWAPGWIRDNREAIFPPLPGQAQPTPLNLAAKYFWGSIPAFDVLQWAEHEGMDGIERDMDIFFPVSGDLRHIIQAVNNLPASFSAKHTLRIYANDFADYVSVRNLLFICMLGDTKGPPPEEVAECVLHLWYSNFITKGQHDFLLQWVERLFPGLVVSDEETITKEVDLGGQAKLTFTWPKSAAELLVSLAKSSYSFDTARDNRRKTQFASSRQDFRDRRMAGLRPRHRVSVLRWLKTGVLLPFGEPVEAFDHPNRLVDLSNPATTFAEGLFGPFRILFSPDGQCILPDTVYILEGYDPHAIEAHRNPLNPPEDLYGSLFFYIKAQLKTFAQQLRTVPLEFTFTCEDARTLAPKLTSGTKFDRIDASNVGDVIGPVAVVETFSPLLKSKEESKWATIFMYSMNWPGRTGGSGLELNEQTDEKVMKEVERMWYKVADPTTGILPPTVPPRHLAPFVISSNLEAFHDNTPAFDKFMDRTGADAAILKAGLKRRTTPSFRPSRFCLDMPKTEGPLNLDANTFYMYGELVGSTWMERFVELEQKE